VIINAQKHEQTPSIEITPVIDMVFLLLIFFLVATTYQQSEREMQIALPEAEAAGPISAVLREIVINIGADGSVVVGGAETSLDGLRAIVSEAVERNPEQKVSVRGDRRRRTASSPVFWMCARARALGRPSWTRSL
jgi:biopolymer transport protein ExbD